MKQYKITIKEAGLRLDKFLTKKEKAFSRNQIQKMIENGEFVVNDKPASCHYCLKVDDVVNSKKVEIKILKPKKMKLPTLKVLFTSDDYLIINKQAGVLVHGAPNIKETSLADVLIKKYPEIKGVGEGVERPGIVHRLDKDVSGLLLVARNEKFYQFAKKQFKGRKVKKDYIGLVYGQVPKETDSINFLIDRAAAGYKMAAKPLTIKGEESKEGKTALTEYTVIKRFINYTLLDIKIKTGRTHQIRAHMAAYGHPLVGDNWYGTSKTKHRNERLGMDRVFLMAYRLGFKDLAGKKQEYEISMPKELKEVLKKIK